MSKKRQLILAEQAKDSDVTELFDSVGANHFNHEALEYVGNIDP